MAGPRGFEGAKKIDGFKRHILVDSAGIMVAAADVQDRAAFPELLGEVTRVAPTIAHLWLDNYTRTTPAPPSPIQPPRPASASTSFPAQNQPAGTSYSHAAGLPNLPIAGSITAIDSTATTKSPSQHIRDSAILSQIAMLLRRLDRS
ncbi:hypothetical protein [Mycolicibacter sinensis]|uniref:hypothetical protein n=1 Tax=Mycolicibacter sinensis (strain JDM601) TaxID=875328 RepID=UPI00104235CC